MIKIGDKNLGYILVLILVCLILGLVSASVTGTASRYEEFRVSESEARECPSQLSESMCKNIPAYNAGSSGGFEGYPLMTGRYYCQSDSDCITVSRKFQEVNAFIFALFYLVLAMAFIYIRNRIRRNLGP